MTQEVFKSGRRNTASSMVAKDDPALAICERNQPNGEAVLIRDKMLQLGVFRLPPLVQLDGDRVGNGRCQLESREASAMASRTSASASAMTLLRSTWLSGERRSSLRRRITGRSVRPLTSRVNSTNPVAKTGRGPSGRVNAGIFGDRER